MLTVARQQCSRSMLWCALGSSAQTPARQPHVRPPTNRATSITWARQGSRATFSSEVSGISAARVAEIEAEIRRHFEETVRPHATADGGDVKFLRFDPLTGVVHVALLGACVGCASSSVTLQFMVRRLLQHHIDEVTEIEGHGMVEDGDGGSCVRDADPFLLCADAPGAAKPRGACDAPTWKSERVNR